MPSAVQSAPARPASCARFAPAMIHCCTGSWYTSTPSTKSRVRPARMRAALRKAISGLRLVEERIVGHLAVRFGARFRLHGLPLLPIGLVHLVEREVEPRARLHQAGVRVLGFGLAGDEQLRGFEGRG